MVRSSRLLPMLLALSSGLSGQVGAECRQTLVVNALDRRDLPFGGLSANDFRATSQGQEVHIVSSQFMENGTGKTIVLLDASGSMGGGKSNKWKIALTAVSEFVSSAPQQMQISFMAFADTIRQKFSAVDGRKAIEEWLQDATTPNPANLKGSTALYDTILTALKELEPRQPGNALYVITDGGDNKSSEAITRLDRELQSTGTRLFVFLLNDAQTEEQRIDARELYELTQKSGGLLVSVGSDRIGVTPTGSYSYDSKVVTAIRTSTRIVEAEIGNYYVLAIQPQNGVSKPEAWKLEAVDVRGRKRKDVSLAYPSKLPGCANVQSVSNQ